MEPGGEYVRQRRLKKEEAQKKIIAALAQGVSLENALKGVNRSEGTFRRWFAEDDWFRRKVEQLRVQNRDPKVTGLGFVELRKAYFKHDSPWHHLEIIRAIERTPAGGIGMVIVPPEGGKTTLLADYINCQIALNPNFRVAYVTEARDLAIKVAGQIKNRFQDEVQFGKFIDDFGPFKPPGTDEGKPWSASRFTVIKSSHDEKEPSVEALGAGSQIYGGRYDLIILDDCQAIKKGALSPSTDNLMVWLRQMVLSRLTRGVGKLVVLGSRLAPQDFYERLEEDEMADHVVRVPALVDPKTRDDARLKDYEHFTRDGRKIVLAGGAEEKAESYWPEHWGLLELAKRRSKIGEDAWWRTYMQIPLEVHAQTFTEEVIQGVLDREMGLQQPRGDEAVVLGVDPALASFAGFVVASYNPDHFVVRDVERYRNLARTEELIGEIDKLCSRWRPQEIIIEEDWNKGLLEDDRVQDVAKRWGAVIVPHQTRHNRQDPLIGIARMATSFVAKELTIPYAGEAKDRMDPLLDELRKWRPDIPPKHLVQDCVMAMWFCWHHWMQQRDSMAAETIPKAVPSWVRGEDKYSYAGVL